ncbi:TetR/AcrR family transcriptional regulator [Caulobacter sp.]|uniref:TetR/AcrR family transcriptional regulator n=1 Tax=Caulobacter sp. TaxID=78 RepID=UPI001AFD8B96|nr:TetR/AcrR family transcriptional regulator [Caulobacter sp.]MBO9544594.1 TetR/AcrR family transcriptional regulator [Caulobacter sp.]
MTTDHALPDAAAGHRGPADHAIRQQIIDAADAHFGRFGYGKTTVADLAKAIGFSKAYIYKFFDSKQAIGEAICAQCLEKILSAALLSAADARSATEKFRKFFSTITLKSTELLFQERLLYDLAANSATEQWPSALGYLARVEETLREIILLGRETGEFERKTPLDETCSAIMLAMQPFMHPLLLEFNLDGLPEAQTRVINLILRSLAP